ncbi:MAG: AbrB/MazE/SpoVT family DNA-binding domain-containing protein [Planctomycetota bacterium]
MAKHPRILKVGKNGEIVLPPDVLEALMVEAGGQVEIHLDERRKSLRVERHVDDAWAEAMKEKPKPAFEDLLADQKDRQDSARRLFDKHLGGTRYPEDKS